MGMGHLLLLPIWSEECWCNDHGFLWPTPSKHRALCRWPSPWSVYKLIPGSTNRRMCLRLAKCALTFMVESHLENVVSSFPAQNDFPIEIKDINYMQWKAQATSLMAVELVLGNKIALFPGYGYEHGWCFMDGFELSIHARISFQQHPTKQQHLPVSQSSILDGRLLSRTGEPIGISRIGIESSILRQQET